MEASNKVLTSYSFLASLNETGNDIYKAVYLPLFKRAMYLYAQRKNTGKDTDIQKTVFDEYEIDMPLVITRKLIEAIEKDLSRREKEKFGYKSFEGGKSFQFNSYSYTSLEESYERERRQINALQEAFGVYVKSETGRTEGIPSFTDFINRYKNELSSFLSGKTKDTKSFEIDASYLLHVKFLKHIESNSDALYKIVEHIYIGVIIASYLEQNIDINTKPNNKVTYFLDTKIVLEALDLQNSEDTLPTKELIKLIRDSGGDIRILDITLTEIQGIISTAIANYNKENPTTTINEACLRIGKNRTWLTTISGRLEDYIKEELKVNISSIPESDLKEFYASKDTTDLKQIWYRKNAAEHDVAAYLYVRKRRKQEHDKPHVQQASCWFVTANKRLSKFNISKKENGHSCEIVMPQDLTSLLFLQNPHRNSQKISSIGLGEIIAQTIFEEYPSKDIINEFDNVIRENENIGEDDYKNLLLAVSHESTIKIQKLLDENIENKEKFNSEVHAMIARERQNRLELERKTKEASEQHQKDEEEKKELARLKQELSEKLDALSKQVGELQQSSTSTEVEYKTLLEENSKLKLKNWKRPRIWAIAILLLMWLFLLILCFCAQDWEYNVSTKIINWIANCDENRKEIAQNVIYGVYSLIGGALLYSILGVILVKDENDKKNWYKTIFSKWIN